MVRLRLARALGRAVLDGIMAPFRGLASLPGALFGGFEAGLEADTLRGPPALAGPPLSVPGLLTPLPVGPPVPAGYWRVGCGG